MDAQPTPAERARAAGELLAAHGPALRRTAQRFSICEADADDALQRSLEILLAKAPSTEPRRLVPWMAVVTRREALALRRGRERLLGAPPSPATAGSEPSDPLERVPCERPGPCELAVRSERVSEGRRALEQLRANERLALVLQGLGYSYVEIASRCGWTYTKVNRCLAEGRAKLKNSKITSS